METLGLVYMLVKVEFDRVPGSIFYQKFDEISQSLRKDYPISSPIKQIKTFSFEVQNGLHDEEPKITAANMPMISFLSPDREFGIKISDGFFIIHTKNYRGFSDMSERMRFILDLLIKMYDISYYSFLGMRYVNKVEYDEQYEFNTKIDRTDFLQPLLCNWMRGGSNMSSSYYDGENQVAITLNSGVMLNGPIVSPDLLETAAELIDPNRRLEGPVAHIDIDTSFASVDESKQPSMKHLIPDEIIQKMNTLRLVANNAYVNIFR
ncbi:TIGR04255 family protein [Providencia rettgeri]